MTAPDSPIHSTVQGGGLGLGEGEGERGSYPSPPPKPQTSLRFGEVVTPSPQTRNKFGEVVTPSPPPKLETSFGFGFAPLHPLPPQLEKWKM